MSSSLRGDAPGAIFAAERQKGCEQSSATWESTMRLKAFELFLSEICGIRHKLSGDSHCFCSCNLSRRRMATDLDSGISSIGREENQKAF